MDVFLRKEGFSPLPPTKDYSLNSTIVTIKDSTDLIKLRTLVDSINYLVQIDKQLELLEYLELNEIIRGKRNVVKEIKQLTANFKLD